MKSQFALILLTIEEFYKAASIHGSLNMYANFNNIIYLL